MTDPGTDASEPGPFLCRRVGTVRSPRTDPALTTHWGGVVAVVELDDEPGADAVTGLQGFSHVEVLYWFDRIERRASYVGTRPARGRADLPPIGVFAARGPHRPTPVGVSTCELLEVDGRRLVVRGLDAVDGTPVLDVKPVMSALLPRGEVREPAWSLELMRDYLDVDPPGTT